MRAGKIWNYFQNLEGDWKELTFLRLEETYISNWKKTDNKTQFLETEKLEKNNLDYVSLKNMACEKFHKSRTTKDGLRRLPFYIRFQNDLETLRPFPIP